ncbi:MAG TPA: hypothetical protein VHF25_03545 [Nitriliruptorales bacterium]|nr:hypothetical protein [Nitriliruptorales bacterium]
MRSPTAADVAFDRGTDVLARIRQRPNSGLLRTYCQRNSWGGDSRRNRVCSWTVTSLSTTLRSSPATAVRRFLSAATAAGVSDHEAVGAVTRHVFGIDLHPVVFTLARVT